MGPADHVAAADVEVVGQPEGDRLRREGLGQRLATRAAHLGDPGGEPRRQHHHLVAGLEDAAGDGPGVAAVVVQVVVGAALGPDHVLDREPGVDQVAVRGDVDLLEVVQQRRALVPGRVVAAADDVVAVQGRHRHEGDVVDLELGGEVAELVADLLEALLRPVDEVHLVDAHHEVRDAEQAGDEGVAAGLLEHAVAGVDEDQGQVGGGGAR